MLGRAGQVGATSWKEACATSPRAGSAFWSRRSSIPTPFSPPARRSAAGHPYLRNHSRPTILNLTISRPCCNRRHLSGTSTTSSSTSTGGSAPTSSRRNGRSSTTRNSDQCRGHSSGCSRSRGVTTPQDPGRQPRPRRLRRSAMATTMWAATSCGCTTTGSSSTAPASAGSPAESMRSRGVGSLEVS